MFPKVNHCFPPSISLGYFPAPVAKPSHRSSTASVEIEVREVSLRRAVRRRGEWQTLRPKHHVGCWFAYIYNILHI